MKRLFCLIGLVITCAVVSGQTKLLAPALGVKMGTNISSLGGDDLSWGERVDFHGGMVAEWAVTPSVLSFTAELLYSREGASTGDLYGWLDGDIYYPTGDKSVLRLSYVQLPVGIKWFWGSMSIDCGMQYGYMLRATGKFDGDFGRPPGVKDANGFIRLPRTQFNTSAWAIWGGASMNYTHFAIGARAIQGLNSALKYDKNSLPFTLQASVSYLF